MTAFCAVCTSERGPFTQQPLGPRNALVNVCSDCDAPIFEQRGPERGFEPNGGLPTYARGMSSLKFDDGYQRLAKLDEMAGRTPAPSAFAPGSDDVHAFYAETFRRQRSGAWKANRRKR